MLLPDIAPQVQRQAFAVISFNLQPPATLYTKRLSHGWRDISTLQVHYKHERAAFHPQTAPCRYEQWQKPHFGSLGRSLTHDDMYLVCTIYLTVFSLPSTL